MYFSSLRYFYRNVLNWREFRPSMWLFPGADPRRPLTVASAQQVYYRARDTAGITRGRGIHPLRHCFASHLLEAGVDIYTVKRLLGHAAISTTAGYLHVSTVHNRPLSSPLLRQPLVTLAKRAMLAALAIKRYSLAPGRRNALDV